MTKVMMRDRVPLIQKTALSIAEACVLAGCGRSTIYKAIGEGVLVARKNGARTVILRSDLDRWLNDLPVADQGGKKVVGPTTAL